MSKKRLSISLIANLLSMIVSFGISFFLTPYLVNSVGKEVYSFYPLANNFTNYATIITIALNSMASRFITVYRAKGEVEKSKKYFTSVFYGDLYLAGIFLIIFVALVIALPNILDIPQGLEFSVRILFSFVFASFEVELISNVFSVATFATERMDLAAIQSIIGSTLRIVLYIVLLKVFSGSIAIIGFVILATKCCEALIRYIYAKKLLPEYNVTKSGYSFVAIKELLSSGIWNSINNLGSTLINGLMLLVANMMINASASGDLAIVQTVTHAISSVITVVYSVLMPRITNVYGSSGIDKAVQITKKTQIVMGILCSVPTVVLIIVGQYFYTLWMPGEDPAYLSFISLLYLSPLLITTAMHTVNGLNMVNNQIRIPAVVLLINGLINVVLVYILLNTTSLGVAAIPLSSAILQIVHQGAFIPWYCCHKLNIKTTTFYPHIIRTVAYAFVCVIVFMPLFSGRAIINSWFVLFVYAMGIGIASFFLYVLVVIPKEVVIGELKQVGIYLSKHRK